MAIRMIYALSATPLAINFVSGAALHIAVLNGYVCIVASLLLVEGIGIKNRKDCARTEAVDHTVLGRCKAVSKLLVEDKNS
jgi:hypothetical protein